MLSKILLASQNRGKLRELKEICADLPFEIISSADLDSTRDLDVLETGKTFEENALIKARAYAKASGWSCVADDSGLEVAALKNEPGVYSARWMEGTDSDRAEGILKRMSGMSDRRAQFVSVVCFFDPKNNTHSCFEGRCGGSIGQVQQGSSGFGYDPIFIPDGYTQSFGQLGKEVKNSLSHRAIALARLKEFLQANYVKTN